jgi:hypothetical protein
MSPWIIFFAVGIGIFVLLFGALESGFRWGLRARRGGNPLPQLGAMQGATLGLLGLLLGFSFSGASGRFIERQDIIVHESNAIGTAYLRADLLSEPHRTSLRSALRSYLVDRLRLFVTLDAAASEPVMLDLERRHHEIWAAGTAGVANDHSITMAVLPPLNEVIDLLAVRNAATERHLPYLVLGLLVSCSAISIALIGYGCGRDGKRQFVGAGSLAFLIAAALWITIDLDNPRLGIIRVSDGPLRTALESMKVDHVAPSP